MMTDKLLHSTQYLSREIKMGTTHMWASLLLSASLLHSFMVIGEELKVARSEGEALETISGGGGYGFGYGPAPSPAECPTPPPPPAECPTPPPPPPECPTPPPPPPPECPTPPPPPPPPPVNVPLQRAGKALVNFSLSIEDPSGYTRNWKKGTNPCNYNGVRCAKLPTTNQDAVAGIDLNGAGLSGKKGTDLTISGILDRIPELTFFHVNSNNFTGVIPPEITTYKYFYELDLSNNGLEGEFPNQVLQAKLLVFLDLRFNRLCGPIPPKLFQLDLDVIFINNNKFSGHLPDNFGSTPARFLTFAYNQLTGPIPRSIGQASKTLTEVLFLGNRLEGCLPFQIGYLNKATVFDVSKNCLTGPIPRSFACLQNIKYLNLEHNKFYGEIPEMLCQLPGLLNLSLSDNYFTQVGPACRKLIHNNVLDVNYNCILGLPNQRPHGQCSRFFSDVKPCPDHKSLFHVPCKGYYSRKHAHHTAPPPPITYNSLNPHR